MPVTTNEPMTRLHPAVVRPGRCLAHIDVSKLSRAEAAAWLGTASGVDAAGATLAELYELRGKLGKIDAPAQVSAPGLYL